MEVSSGRGATRTVVRWTAPSRPPSRTRTPLPRRDEESSSSSSSSSRARSNSDAANLRGLMAGFGSRNTAMDRLIDDSRSDVAPSEAPSTVFEINPPRWVARMFGAGGRESATPRWASRRRLSRRRSSAVTPARRVGVQRRGLLRRGGVRVRDAPAGRKLPRGKPGHQPGHPHHANRRRRTGRGARARRAGGRDERDAAVRRAAAAAPTVEVRGRRRRRRRRRRGGGSRRGRLLAPRWPARAGRCPRIDRRGSSSRRRGSCDGAFTRRVRS